MAWYKGILHTAGKTIEEIKAAEENWEYTDADALIIKNYLDAWDGVQVTLMDSGDGAYSIIGWPPEEDTKAANAIYLMEQDPVFGSYVNNREAFDQDWKDGAWEPAGAITFPKESVEITETHMKTDKEIINGCFLIEKALKSGELKKPRKKHGKCLGYRMKQSGDAFFECSICPAFIDFKY